MKSILDKSRSCASSFKTDLEKKPAAIPSAQSKSVALHLFTPLEPSGKAETFAIAPCMKQEDINHYAALNQFGHVLACRRLETEF